MMHMHDYNLKPIHNINPITEITHSPLYPMILLTLYLFAIGFTIGNYTGYFRFNTDVYGDNFVRAYLAFTVLGAASYFLVAGVAWLWAAKYVTSVESRIRKLTFGFIAIFLLHDLPCFSMELHAILEYGWRNGYQGFVFVVQIITFLLSFTNGWLYYTWVTASWCQYWYGWPRDSFELKTGQEQLSILPPMSPAERQEMVSTPMLGSGLRWNTNNASGGGGQSGGTQQRSSMMHQREPSSYSQRASSQRAGSNSGMRRQGSSSQFITPRNEDQEEFDVRGPSGSRGYNNHNNNNKIDDDMLFSSSSQQQQRQAPNSGLRRQQQQQQNPPEAFGPASNNNNNSNYNFREQHAYRQSHGGGGGDSGIRPVNFIDGLEEGGEQPPSSTRSSSLAFQQQQPVSLMTSPAMSRLRTSTSGNYAPMSPSKNGGNGILKLETLRSPGANSDASTVNQGWRDNLPPVTSGGGPNGSNVQWTNNRKNML